MPTPLTRVPPGVLAVRARDAVPLGLSPAVLRHPRWTRVTRGCYLPAERSALSDRAAAVAALLPRDSGFGHLTAAALRGWWLPNGVGEHPVLFASTTSQVHVQRRGVYVRRSAYTAVEGLSGLPVVTAAETLLELAQDLGLVDLVPLVDCALARGASPDELLAAARPRSRGARVLRTAITLADRRSESWWESVLRLLLVTTGLGPVESQVELRAGDEFVARADLHLVGTARYPECDGGDHRTAERHQRDLQREKAMSRLGAERYGYTTAEIAHGPATIIADAENARGFPHDPARVARWWQLARRSTLTGHGRAVLRGRLARYRRASHR